MRSSYPPGSIFLEIVFGPLIASTFACGLKARAEVRSLRLSYPRVAVAGFALDLGVVDCEFKVVLR